MHRFGFHDFIFNQVVTGRHPDGTELEADMPRWRMSDSDLVGVFASLKALSE